MSRNVMDFFGTSGSSKKDANMKEPRESSQAYESAAAGWSEWRTEDGEVYYYNSVTDESSWECPPELMTDAYEWEEHYTEEGEVYYYNNVTQCNQWEYPYAVDDVPQQSEPVDDLEWMEYCTDDGYPYYYNVYTEEVQWENPYASYNYSGSYDGAYYQPEPEPEPQPALYALESSTDRHLEIWSKFFENAFANQEWMEEERRKNKAKAKNRAAKAAKLEAVLNQWPSRLSEKRFRSLISNALANRAHAEESLFGDDEDLNEALLAAVTQDEYSSAESLLLAGANPNCTDQCIRSAGHYAAKSGNAELLALLYDQGADLEMVDQVGRTPLHIAAVFGREGVAEFLLACAVDVEGPPDHSGNTPLHLAARGGHVGIVRLLLQFGASVKENNSGGMTALKIAQTMHPQTSQHLEVIAELKQSRKKKKRGSKLLFNQSEEGATSVSPVKSVKGVSAQYQAMHSEWLSADSDNSPSKNKTSSRGSSSRSELKAVADTGTHKAATASTDREWKIVRSSSYSSSGGGLSDQLLSDMRIRLNRRLDDVSSKLLARLPPRSVIAGIISNLGTSDQSEYRLKLKPFLIEESVTFPARCPHEIEQQLESARAHNNLGRCEEAVKYLESAARKSAAAAAAAMKSLDLELYITLCKGNVYQSCGDDEQSLLTYMEGWTRAAAKNDLDWEVIAINAIGILAYYNLRFDVSLLCFHLVGNYRVDTYSEESVDTATAWNNEACCLYCLNKKGEARIKFERAWKGLSSLPSEGPEGSRTLTVWKNLEKARRSHSAGPSESSERSTSGRGSSVVASQFLRSESEGVGSASSPLKLPSISFSSGKNSASFGQGKKFW